jgi:hypothetical protein
MEMTAEMVPPCMEMTAEQKHTAFNSQCIFPKAIRQAAELHAATDCSIVPNVSESGTIRQGKYKYKAFTQSI